MFCSILALYIDVFLIFTYPIARFPVLSIGAIRCGDGVGVALQMCIIHLSACFCIHSARFHGHFLTSTPSCIKNTSIILFIIPYISIIMFETLHSYIFISFHA